MKLDTFDTSTLIDGHGPDFEDQLGTSIYIIKSEYNKQLVDSIFCSARYMLSDLGVMTNEIGIQTIPGGVFELVLATKRIVNLRNTKPDVVILLIQN